MIQIGRGVYHTPGAVSASMSGKDWDDEKKEWTAYNLPNEAGVVLSMSDEEFLATLDAHDVKAFEEMVRGVFTLHFGDVIMFILRFL